MYQNKSKIRIPDMCENGKPQIVSKLYGFLLKLKDRLQFKF